MKHDKSALFVAIRRLSDVNDLSEVRMSLFMLFSASKDT